MKEALEDREFVSWYTRLCSQSTSEWTSGTRTAGSYGRRTSSPQRRPVRSSPADTFHNLIDRAYFLLKTSQVGLTHAELTSILAG